MGTIVAIGGYQYESDIDEIIKTPLEIDLKILKLTNKKKPKVLFIPTASSDKTIYVNSIKKIYHDQLRADFDTLLLYNNKLSKEDIQKKIYWADVVYVGGGNTLMMMKKWRKLGINEMLKNAYRRDKVLCGVSAGSICWFEYGVSDSLHFYNYEIKKYIKVTGLGIIPGIYCPHFRSELWDKGDRTSQMKKIMRKEPRKCIAVPDGCAVIIQNNQYSSIGLNRAKECYWSNGNWVEDEI